MVVRGPIRSRLVFVLLLTLVIPLLSLLHPLGTAYAEDVPIRKLVYDEAGLLNEDERAKLNIKANKLGAERETDIMIYTSKNDAGVDVMKLMQDFYDKEAPGYDKAHGNTVILTVDMKNRQTYLGGFYKAETYLDDGRLDRIRNQISPDLSAGDYYGAFSAYIETAHRYMGYKPGVNPDLILFKWWFQVGVAGVVALLVVWRLVANSGGRVTVHNRTYENTGSSGIVGHRDQYIRTTVTKRHIPKPSSGGGGGGRGGGGTTSGGHSHSGSRGSF
ncbi:TPM domain-containing protein [Paenibacillus sp. strain BS8-2]